MTLPNQYLPGSVYLITRRTVEGQFFLTPDNETNQIILYSMAHASKTHNIKIHAFVVMSNHIHIILSDKMGNLPFFLRDFFAMVAKPMNKKLKKSENFWSSDKPGITRLMGDEDVISKIVYTLVNPVNAKLVRRHTKWPGAITTIHDIKGKTIKVKRPKYYFRKNGSLSSQLKLQITDPPFLKKNIDYHSTIIELVKKRETEIIVEHGGKPFLGCKKVMNQNPRNKPFNYLDKSRVNPRIACSNKSLRKKELQKLKNFRKHYYEAYHKWKNGDKEAIFPAGTFAMRVFHQAKIGIIATCEP